MVKKADAGADAAFFAPVEMDPDFHLRLVGAAL
jgi:hypothetical protein